MKLLDETGTQTELIERSNARVQCSQVVCKTEGSAQTEPFLAVKPLKRNCESQTDTDSTMILETNKWVKPSASDEPQLSKQVIKLQEELKQRIQQSRDQEIAYGSQMAQLMELLKEERLEQARLRESLMDSIKDKKNLRQKLQDEYKKQFQDCTNCVSIKKKLKKSQEEADFNQELYFSQKTQYNEECHKYRVSLNEMRQENKKLKIENSDLQTEKRTIMRKLVQTMLKYE